MGEVIKLDDLRPHILIGAIDGKHHIIPVKLLQDIVHDKIKITDVDQYEIIIRSILKDWLRTL